MRSVLNSIVFSGVLVFTGVCNSYGQLEKGINIQLGLSSIRSGNLKDYYTFLKKENSNTVNSNSHSNLGGYVGAGGRLVYPLSSKFSIQSELNLSYQSSKIFINYETQNLDVTRSGIKDRITSQLSVRVVSLSLPLLAKYKFSEKNYFLLSGFTFNFNPKPTIKSNEKQSIGTYSNGLLVSSDFKKVNNTVRINKFNPVNIMFSLGVEKRMKRGLKNLSVSIRGNYSLTKSQMYSNSNSFFDESLNNKVFTSQGQSIGGLFSGIKFNDFRMSSYFLTITYHLKGKAKLK